MTPKKVTKDKFKTNEFAKKWKEGLADEAYKNACQVKSWSRHERENTIDKLGGYIIAFSLGGLITLAVTNL